MKYITKSEKETIELGKKFGKELKGGEVFLLTGDLGGGKTRFVKGLAVGLKVKESVTSPTFIYENIYLGRDNLKLYHFDLYRSNRVDEDILGLILEAFSDESGVTVVEWAERLKGNWPEKYHHLNFVFLGENEREILLKSKIKKKDRPRQ